ncbi:phosphopantetheine-binding protein [Micromonospora arborensis]|jgi:acyl carrier protein|uniref:Phosphopantetheine-binding protein n=1 Tax=Micromonospora arborensis TaxID=2116518 RepID=A0A318NEY5_9ACTN|nr:acyl carrier protein [Micromonospora arborensis]PYC66956.1 phosphopantetheine-binding protein [Micromonospora arborensis]
MWDDQFEVSLRRHLPFIAPGEQLTPDTSLRDFGLDSLGTVELLAALESAYDVRFSDDALSMETFETPEVLWTTLSTLRTPA